MEKKKKKKKEKKNPLKWCCALFLGQKGIRNLRSD